MEKNEFRTVIKHFNTKGNTPKEIKVELDDVYGTPVSRMLHLSTVLCCHLVFEWAGGVGRCTENIVIVV